MAVAAKAAKINAIARAISGMSMAKWSELPREDRKRYMGAAQRAIKAVELLEKQRAKLASAKG